MNDSASTAGILAAVAGFYLIFFLIFMTIVIVPFWFILKKAGFSPWLSLINLFPTFGTLILLYILAFSEWKVLPPPMGWQPPSSYPPPPYPPQA